jgi:hypothetical protein
MGATGELSPRVAFVKRNPPARSPLDDRLVFTRLAPRLRRFVQVIRRHPAMATSGKIAVITGAGSGIGRATALALYVDGFSVLPDASKSDVGSRLGPADTGPPVRSLCRLVERYLPFTGYISRAEHVGRCRKRTCLYVPYYTNPRGP